MLNQQLLGELQKPAIRKFDKLKINSFFVYDVWGFVLPDMQLISKFNKGI